MVAFTIDLVDRSRLYPFDERGLALSPDGVQLAYVATGADGGRRQIFLRRLASTQSTVLEGTENASYPFWSPDGHAIAFFADGKLKKVAAEGGPVQVLCDAPSGRGGTWSQNGTILFEPTITTGLERVSSGGGKPEAATTLAGVSRHRWPSFLPDGEHFLVTGDEDIYVGKLGSTTLQKIIPDGSNAEFVEPDRVVYARGNTLIAQKIDPTTFQALGDPIALSVGGVARWNPKRYAAFSTTRRGSIAFLPEVMAASRLLWVDRQGRMLETIGEPAVYQDAILSPDGKTVAVVKGPPANGDIWLVDVATQRWSRATFTPGDYGDLTWSWDVSRLAYMFVDKGVGQVFVKALARDDAPIRITNDKNFSAPFSISPDGRTLIIGAQRPETQWDLLSTSIDAKAEHDPLVVTPYSESRGRFSPDGKWFAYDSTESGRSEIYVRRFPPTIDQWQISTEGGTSAFWSADGKTLYYVGPESLTSVPIGGGDRLDPGHGVALFPVPTHWRAGALLTSGPLGSMTGGVMPDGQKFLFQSTENDRLGSINVILNADVFANTH
jgi:Tol biopolymer transport system component